MTVAVASAPGKVILFGEHGVNRQQPAIAGAVDRRVRCRVATRPDDVVDFSFERCHEALTRDEILEFRAKIDRLRQENALDDLCGLTRADFFAPARYVVGHLLEETRGGLDVTWRTELAIGSGLGSGAASAAAMVDAVAEVAGLALEPAQIAHLAWQGDVIAHGGVASGLDSGACALGGLTLYTLADGPVPLLASGPLTLVVGDTRVRADTAEINTRVRRSLEAHPARHRLFAEIGLLVRQALEALRTGDLETLGRLMNLNQLVLEKLGVSCPEIEALTEAALAAGALGAKLSGSGGGGIVIALAPDGREEEVVEAIERAGGSGMVARLGVPGARLEPHDSEERSQDRCKRKNSTQ